MVRRLDSSLTRNVKSALHVYHTDTLPGLLISLEGVPRAPANQKYSKMPQPPENDLQFDFSHANITSELSRFAPKGR
jgi:hypothetical protein